MRDLALRLLARFWRAGRAADEVLVRRAKLQNVMHGEGSVVDFSRISAKPGSRLSIGTGSMFAGTCILERDGAEVSIGDRTYFSGLISCASKVTIGNDVLVSQGGYIADHGSHAIEFTERASDVADWIAGRKDWGGVPIGEVAIGDKAWVGFDVIILSGVTIGEGAVVGAGSVVTKNVPPYTVVAGNPAREIRRLISG